LGTESPLPPIYSTVAELTQAERRAALGTIDPVEASLMEDRIAEVERQLSSPLINKRERKALIDRLRKLKELPVFEGP
jgi:hypothetical protein